MRFSESGMDVLKTSDGTELDIHIWDAEKPKAVIMAIHGGLAHAGDYVTPALYFKERSISTVSELLAPLSNLILILLMLSAVCLKVCPTFDERSKRSFAASAPSQLNSVVIDTG